MNKLNFMRYLYDIIVNCKYIECKIGTCYNEDNNTTSYSIIASVEDVTSYDVKLNSNNNVLTIIEDNEDEYNIILTNDKSIKIKNDIINFVVKDEKTVKLSVDTDELLNNVRFYNEYHKKTAVL